MQSALILASAQKSRNPYFFDKSHVKSIRTYKVSSNVASISSALGSKPGQTMKYQKKKTTEEVKSDFNAAAKPWKPTESETVVGKPSPPAESLDMIANMVECAE
jgi:hypothetical protein